MEYCSILFFNCIFVKETVLYIPTFLILKQTLKRFRVSFYTVLMLNSDLVMIDTRKEFRWYRSKLHNMKNRLCSKVPPTKYKFFKDIFSGLQGLYLINFFLF